jgi:hypothetical protein
MSTEHRREVALVPPSSAWSEHGLIEIRYVGTVDERTTQRVVDEIVGAVEVPFFVYVIDLSKLDSMTPGARKAFASMKLPAGTTQQTLTTELFFYIVGATIKTKAIFALALAAARLLGPLRFHTQYVDDAERARALAHSKRDELIRTNKLPPLPAR